MNNLLRFVIAIGLVIILAVPVYGKSSEIKVTLEWKSGKLMSWLDEAWGIAAFDVDGDGVKDIIVPVNGNNVSVFSGATHKEIDRFQVANNSFFSYLFNYAFVSQMDNDKDRELVLGAMGMLWGNIFVVDLKTHEIKMQLSTPGGCMYVYDVNGDGKDEIITASNHVEIYKLGSTTPIAKSVNITGNAVSMTAVNTGNGNTLFVASVKEISNLSDITNPKYYGRIYEFSLPDLKVLLNVSAGKRDLHTIAVGDVNNDGNDEIVVGSGDLLNSSSGHITIYSLKGTRIWDSKALGEPIENVKIADLLNNGQKYLIVASQNIEIWNATTKRVVWKSEMLYDVGEDGGLLVTKLSNNNTTEIITRAYAYSEGGRVYVYGVSVPPSQNGNNSNPTRSPTPPNDMLIYYGLIATAAVAAILGILLLRKRSRVKKTQKENNNMMGKN